MNVQQNFDRQSIETFVLKKHPKFRGDLPSGVSCEPKEVTSKIQDVLEVLVVDGNHENGSSKVELIRRLGHTVRWAVDGHQGLRMAATHRPDVVLLNIDLVPRDGCQVATHLRVDFPIENILIIGVATTAHKTLRQRCVQAGIDLVIESPIDGDVLEILLLLECVRLHRVRKVELTQLAKSNSCKGDPPADPENGWLMSIQMRSQTNSYLVH